VVQQERGGAQQYDSRRRPAIGVSQEGDVEEIEARIAADRVTVGKRTAISAPPAKTGVVMMRQPPPPTGGAAPTRLSAKALEVRANEIYRQAVSAFLKQEGKPVTEAQLGQFRKQLTVGVLQGVRNGKLVTMVNGHNPAFEKFVKASLKPGEENIEPV